MRTIVCGDNGALLFAVWAQACSQVTGGRIRAVSDRAPDSPLANAWVTACAWRGRRWKPAAIGMALVSAAARVLA